MQSRLQVAIPTMLSYKPMQFLCVMGPVIWVFGASFAVNNAVTELFDGPRSNYPVIATQIEPWNGSKHVRNGAAIAMCRHAEMPQFYCYLLWLDDQVWMIIFCINIRQIALFIGPA